MNDIEHKTVCDTCGMPTWYETEQPCKRTVFKGCLTCGSHEYIDTETKCPGTLRLIDNSQLDERLTPFYKSGERVEVTYKEDGVKISNRFWVGKSTGWKPIYLEIKRQDSMGGGAVYIPDNAEVKHPGIFK